MHMQRSDVCQKLHTDNTEKIGSCWSIMGSRLFVVCTCCSCDTNAVFQMMQKHDVMGTIECLGLCKACHSPIASRIIATILVAYLSHSSC